MQQLTKVKIMKDLLKERKKQLKSTKEINWAKLQGDAQVGKKVMIKWTDRPKIDDGYLFSLPMCTEDEGDLFIHVPSPNNDDGMDDAPPVWIHLPRLLSFERVKYIVVKD